jgi:hypothetical protein
VSHVLSSVVRGSLTTLERRGASESVAWSVKKSVSDIVAGSGTAPSRDGRALCTLLAAQFTSLSRQIAVVFLCHRGYVCAGAGRLRVRIDRPGQTPQERRGRETAGETASRPVFLNLDPVRPWGWDRLMADSASYCPDR